MDKYGMQEYIEENFEKIIEDHFEVFREDSEIAYDGLEYFTKNIDTLNFYKAYKESPKLKVTFFLKEIEGDEENNKDSKGTQL